MPQVKFPGNALFLPFPRNMQFEKGSAGVSPALAGFQPASERAGEGKAIERRRKGAQ
jgi:hypothetical protein